MEPGAPTTSGDPGIVKAWAPAGAYAWALGRINPDSGEAEHGYWIDVESEVAHQRERGVQVAECDGRGEAVFEGTPQDAAIAHLETEVAHLRSAVHELESRVGGAGAVLAAPDAGRRVRRAAVALDALLRLPTDRRGAGKRSTSRRCGSHYATSCTPSTGATSDAGARTGRRRLLVT